MGLFDLLKEETKVEEPQKEEIKEAEVVENEAAVNEPEKEVTMEKGSGGDKSYTANWEPVKTATSEDETKDKGTPTGDGFDPLLWGALLLSSAAVLAVLYGRRRRNR